MRVVHLTAGAGGWFCGTCIRDNALVRALRRVGVEAELVPLYLPILAEGEACSAQEPVLMGGVNVWLQHTSAVFRSVPKWMDAPLSARPLLSLVGRSAGSTRADELGALTLSMLAGEDGPIHKEVDRLALHLEARRPDVIVLSNSLLGGLAPALRRRLGVPVLVTVQGECHFIDAMGAHAAGVWAAVGARLEEADGVIAVSRFAAERMEERTGIAVDRFAVVHNGVDLSGWDVHEEASPPTLTFLSRLTAAKGLHEIVEVFLALHEAHPTLALRVAGTLQGGDRADMERATQRLAEAGVSDRVHIEPNITSERKRALLSATTVFCVPTQKDETFGQYYLEALAAGAPVVAPRRGAIGEVLEQTGGAVLVPAGDRQALVDAIDALLRDPARRRALGDAGRRGVEERFSDTVMGRHMAHVLSRFVGAL